MISLTLVSYMHLSSKKPFVNQSLSVFAFPIYINRKEVFRVKVVMSKLLF